jgi:hypothetical protein
MTLCLLTTLSSIATAGAQDAGRVLDRSNPLWTLCEERLFDIVQDRRLCVVGIVKDDTHMHVIFATRPDVAGRLVSIFRTGGAPARAVA